MPILRPFTKYRWRWFWYWVFHGENHPDHIAYYKVEQMPEERTPAQSSPCLRYVNSDAELVCKCVKGKYPEVVDMERRPPTCLGTVQK